MSSYLGLTPHSAPEQWPLEKKIQIASVDVQKQCPPDGWLYPGPSHFTIGNIHIRLNKWDTYNITALLHTAQIGVSPPPATQSAVYSAAKTVNIHFYTVSNRRYFSSVLL